MKANEVLIWIMQLLWDPTQISWEQAVKQDTVTESANGVSKRLKQRQVQHKYSHMNKFLCCKHLNEGREPIKYQWMYRVRSQSVQKVRGRNGIKEGVLT